MVSFKPWWLKHLRKGKLTIMEVVVDILSQDPESIAPAPPGFVCDPDMMCIISQLYAIKQGWT